MTARLDVYQGTGEAQEGVVHRRDLKILWVCPYLPLPVSGAGSRVFNLIKALAPTAEIDLIASTNAWHERHELADELRSLCRRVEIVQQVAPTVVERRIRQTRSLMSRRPAQYWTVYSSEMQDRIDQAAEDGGYDVGIVEHSFAGYYRMPEGIPVVLDQHNVESEILQRAGRRDRSRGRRALNSLEYWKFRFDERRICRAASLVLAASDRDRDAMLSWGGVRTCDVVPNGVDVRTFSPGKGEPNQDMGVNVLFTGPLHYAPNAEAVLHFGREIWPLIHQQRPDARFIIVGANPPKEVLHLAQTPGVKVAGFVPDVRVYLTAAQVVIAPLRIGGGTRLKILEAFAMGRSVVSTSIGCEGLDVEDGRHLLVADDPTEFAASVVALLADPVLRESLGRQGRSLVEERYDWRAIGHALDDALRRLVKGAQGGAPFAEPAVRGH